MGPPSQLSDLLFVMGGQQSPKVKITAVKVLKLRITHRDRWGLRDHLSWKTPAQLDELSQSGRVTQQMMENGIPLPATERSGAGAGG